MRDYLGILAFLAVGAVVASVADLYWLDMLIFALWYVYLCVTWNIVGGFAGQFTFAHPVYVSIGGYTSTLLYKHLGLSPWIGTFAGMILAVIVALVLSWISFRRRLPHLTYALITLAMTFLGVMVLRSTELLGGSEGIFISRGIDPLYFKFVDKRWYFWIILIAVCLVLAFVAWMRDSRLGLEFVALRDNQDAASMLGINTLRTMLIASGISAGLAAFGGTFLAQYLFVIDPSAAGADLAIEIILLTAIGGIGTIWGPVFGPLLLITASRYLTQQYVQVPGLGQALYGLLIIVTLVALRDGAVSKLQYLMRRRRKRQQGA